MPPVPLWLALLGLFGNAAVFAVLYFRGDPVWILFLIASIVSYGTAIRAKEIAVRTAEREAECTCSESGFSESGN